MNASLRHPRQLSMSEMVADFCGQDAFMHRRIGRASDAITMGSMDRRGYHAMMFEDFVIFKAFVDNLAVEFSLPLTRENVKPDRVERVIDGECLRLSGEHV